MRVFSSLDQLTSPCSHIGVLASSLAEVTSKMAVPFDSTSVCRLVSAAKLRRKPSSSPNWTALTPRRSFSKYCSCAMQPCSALNRSTLLFESRKINRALCHLDLKLRWVVFGAEPGRPAQMSEASWARRCGALSGRSFSVIDRRGSPHCAEQALKKQLRVYSLSQKRKHTGNRDEKKQYTASSIPHSFPLFTLLSLSAALSYSKNR